MVVEIHMNHHHPTVAPSTKNATLATNHGHAFIQDRSGMTPMGTLNTRAEPAVMPFDGTWRAD